MALDDVQNAVIDSLDAPYASEAAGMIRLSDCSDITVRNCRPPTGADPFLDVTGPKSSNILLFSNDLSKAREVLRTTDDVPPSAVVLAANRTTKE
jgi:hypothetical protein